MAQQFFTALLKEPNQFPRMLSGSSQPHLTLSSRGDLTPLASLGTFTYVHC